MQNIAIIGASYLQLPLVKKANELGYATHVFAWESGAVAKEYATKFYPISITEKEAILEVCQRIQPVAIVSIGSDLAVPTVNYIARRLGLVCNPEETDVISTNKYLMRKTFELAGVPSARYKLVDKCLSPEEGENLAYPVIVKATDRSGSRGVTKVTCPEMLQEAIDGAINESFEKRALIEEFIEGEEYSCECISYEGKHHFLAFTKKFVTSDGHFIETGHLEPAPFSDERAGAYKKTIFKALDALHIKYGASHTEFKVQHDGSIRIIEIGSRMGGDYIGSEMVRLSTGFDFVKMVIEAACGKTPVFERVCEPRSVLVRFIMNDLDRNVLGAVRSNSPQLLYSAVEFDKSNACPTDSSSRHGVFILVADRVGDLTSFFPNVPGGESGKNTASVRL